MKFHLKKKIEYIYKSFKFVRILHVNELQKLYSY